MADHYRAQKAALHVAAGYILTAGEDWVSVCSRLANAKLAAGDLGLIGDKGHAVSEYNAGVDQVWQQVASGVHNINMMALALEAVAASYGQADHRAITELKKVIR